MVFCANQGKKRRNPLWIASIFDADWRKSTPLQAMLPYGVSPNACPFYWYQETCKRKYPLGQYSLGRCYEFGLGIPQFDEMAFFWYQRSAHQGYVEAMYSLANCYQNGYGVEQDDNKAGYWFDKAAKLGHEKSKEAILNYKKGILKKYRRIEYGNKVEG